MVHEEPNIRLGLKDFRPDSGLLSIHFSMTEQFPAFSKASADPNPIQQFTHWYEEAVAAGVDETDAMTLATATSSGNPSARIVLLKGFDERGFVFYTNYESRKAKELAENSRVSLLFYWMPIKRQVRIQGAVEKVSPEESDQYFHSRPLGSKIGAWASNQSEVIESRTQLEKRFEEFGWKFGDNVPRPPHWGGYRVKPDTIEFWQGRENRLHDRLRYRLQADGSWLIERLGP
jgi:pyridoxamine 5'-phosphate oxidase